MKHDQVRVMFNVFIFRDAVLVNTTVVTREGSAVPPCCLLRMTHTSFISNLTFQFASISNNAVGRPVHRVGIAFITPR